MSKRIKQGTLTIRCFTWGRDSHGLFDYESRMIIRSTFKTSKSGHLFRVGNECNFATDLDPDSEQSIVLASLVSEPPDFVILS